MSTFSELLATHTEFSGDQALHLQQLVAEWQLLSDLSFSDLQLWVRSERDTVSERDTISGATLVCVAQVRPNTAATVLPADEVGFVSIAAQLPTLASAFGPQRALLDWLSWTDASLIRHEVIPIQLAGKVIGALTRSVSATELPRLSSLESAYQECAQTLCQMMAAGIYPAVEVEVKGLAPLRAGDGFIRLDRRGVVGYASPNALSAYHRMGVATELAKKNLAEVSATVVDDRFVAEELVQMISGGVSGGAGARIEIDAQRATVLIQTVPLRRNGLADGSIVLVRDVTELKQRDRALISKDATIREIHHRVKNNLQSVSALLRLQARRSINSEAKQALGEAIRRVASIALVHEMLSASVDEDVNLDFIVDRLVPIISEVASEAQITISRLGSLGVVSAVQATPIVMVLSELIQNSLEHGFAAENVAATEGFVAQADSILLPRVEITGRRSARTLVITVSDNGSGIPDGFVLAESNRLGLTIVTTLAEMELGGTLTFSENEPTGTVVTLTIPLT